MMNEVQQTSQVNYSTFEEAHPQFSAYCVMGGYDFEGESIHSMRLFDSKVLSQEYAKSLLDNYDYARRFVISNDGTPWKMPGSNDFYQMENNELKVKTW